MSEMTDRQLHELVSALNNLSGNIKKVDIGKTNNSGSNKASSQLEVEVRRQSKLTAIFGKNAEKHADSAAHYGRTLDDATRNTDRFSTTLASAARKMPAGFIIAAIATYANNALDTYQDLSDIGQTFGGSMVTMSVAAGHAGLGLREFGEISKSNAAVLGHMGDRFFDVNSTLRKTTEYAGNFGMTLKQLYEVSGGYLENQRLMGAINSRSSTDQASAIADMAESVSTMSGVTKKARADIIRDSNQSLRDSAVMAMMTENTRKGFHSLNDSIIKVTNNLSAQFGGQAIADALLQTMSLGGVQFSEQAEKFLEGGFSEGMLLVQQAADKMAAGIDPDTVSMELNNSIKDAVDNPVTREALLNQARAGNAHAKEILAMAQNLKKYTAADLAQANRDAKQKELLTGLMTSLESIMGRLRGSFIEGFLTPFSKALGGTDWADTLDKLKEAAKPLEASFKSLGNAWGREFKSWLESGGPSLLATTLGILTKQAIRFATIVFSPENIDTAARLFGLLTKIATYMGVVATAVFIPFIEGGLRLVEMVDKAVSTALKWVGLNGEFSDAAGALVAGVLAMAGAWFAKQKISGMLGRIVGAIQIRAAQVTVIGGNLGGGGADVGGGGKGKGKGGANRGGAGAGRGARGMGRIGGRIGGGLTRLGGAIGRMPVSTFAGRAAGAAALPLSVILAGMSQADGMRYLNEKLASGEITSSEHKREMKKLTGGNIGSVGGGVGGALLGAKGGALAGAGIGALFGGVGAVPGAAIGGVLGGIGGGIAGSSLGKFLGEQVGGFLSTPEGKIMTAIVNPSAAIVGGAANLARGRPLFGNDTVQGAPNNLANAERIGSAATGKDQSVLLKELIEGINRLNKGSDESRQIGIAQLERLERANLGQREVSGAIADGSR